MYHSLPEPFRKWLSNFLVFLHCVVAVHGHDIEAGQKHELQEQYFVNGQGLDLCLKNFQNDFAKNKMAPWRMDIWRSTLRVQWLPSIHIRLKALLLLERLPDNILKLKELFLSVYPISTGLFISL